MFKLNSYHLFTDIVIACGSIPKGNCGTIARGTRSLLPQRRRPKKSRTGHDEGGSSPSTKLPSFKEDFDRIADHWHWQGNAAGLAGGKANISSFGALVCAPGRLVLGVWAPETEDMPMERMEELFGGPGGRPGGSGSTSPRRHLLPGPRPRRRTR
ncbi:hypothetical protein DL766_005029 [Monosporascus sp. MC13-8B]|uniref:Uncharacterized protein n=1 Tax=Monosporascus cannonballus TaxID=155416 RepID=A0ABY0GV00_9PEZI|nr:hypothetical protein DL762_009180 [Monosporascus cannonballus]RYO85162.1 hypothetical protein DL763_007185 [Monosporascus cannonballus]RYP30093.1 hypothetical protein DL766_005029 [Monosporascus sp. MC13-8B]